MSGAALGAAVLTTALVLLPRASAAQTGREADGADNGSEAVSLSYEVSAPPDCPSEADFEAEVVKLTGKARFTQQRGARRIRIELESRGSDVVGRFVSGDGKNQSSREVRGKDCREVSSALAIAVALTIDPEALGRGEAEPTAEPPSPTPAPASPAPPLKPKPQPQPAAAPSAERPAPASTRARLGFGAGFEIESAWAPQLGFGGTLFGLLAVGERFRATLGGSRFPTRQGGQASFGAWLGYGSLSLNLAVFGLLRPFASLGFEAGAVDAVGKGLPTNRAARRRWEAASVGLGLRIETDDVFLQVGGCLLVPVSRQRYLVSDPLGSTTTFYEVPWLGVGQETSLGVFL